MEDNEWLKDLNVGDKVFVRHGYDSKNMSIRTIKKITPKKNIRLNNDLLFKNGECRQGVWSSDYYLIQWSQETENELRNLREQRSRVNKLDDINWQDVNVVIMDATYDALYEAGVFDE